MADVIEFDPVTLTGDWQATEALSVGGPIILVKGRSVDGKQFSSRFDVQKAMFIDVMPFRAPKAGAQNLVEALNVSVKEPSW